MKTNQKKTVRGFTFIELLIGMTLIGVVAAMAVPHYVDAAQQAKDDSLWEQSIAVKDAHDAVINKSDSPTVIRLVAEMPSDANANAVAAGVQVQVLGVTYIVPTYSNTLCTELTKSVSDKVSCVGAIAS